MQILILGLLASFFLAGSDILAKFLLQRIKVQELMPINFWLIGIILILFAPFCFYLQFTKIAIFLVILIALLDAVANYFYFRAIKHSEVSYVMPILAVAPLFTLIFSSVFIKGSATLQIGIATLLIVVALYILNFKDKIYNPISLLKQKKNYLMLLAALLYGISAIPTKYALSIYNVVNPYTLYLIKVIIIAILATLLFRKSVKKLSKKDLLTITGRSLFVIVGWLFYLYAISLGNVNYAIAVSSLSPLFVFIFASILFKEKITRYKILAVLIIIFGLLIFNVK